MILKFAQPFFLYGFIALVPLVYVMLRNRRRHPASFSYLRSGLILIAFSFCILGLARPQLGKNTTESLSVKTNLFLAVDVSRSMLAQDVPPSRLAFAAAFTERLLSQLDGAKVAVYPFALDGYLQIPLTTDVSAAIDVIASLSPNTVPNQGSDLSNSLETLYRTILKMEAAVKTRGEDWFPTQVVLLSDGESHYPIRKEVAAAFRQKRIPIYSVGLGTAQGSRIPVEGRFGELGDPLRDRGGNPVLTRLNQANLSQISQDSGGDYFVARFDEVNRLTKRITQSMQMGKLSTSFKAQTEYFPLCFLIALLLFIIDFARGRWHYAIRAVAFALLFGAASLPRSLHAEIEKVENIEKSESETADISEDPEIRAAKMYNRGSRELKKGNLDKAVEYFQESAAMTTNLRLKKQALFNAGTGRIKQYDPAQAIELLQQAYDVNATDKSFNGETNRKISDNLALAGKLLQQLQNRPQEGDGDGEGDSEGKDKKGDRGNDQKAPKKFQAQDFSDLQKKRIFDLMASEEQQTMQRIQEQRSRNRESRIAEKPW